MTRLRRRTFVVRAATVMAAAPWLGCGDDGSGTGDTEGASGGQPGTGSGAGAGPTGTSSVSGTTGGTTTTGAVSTGSGSAGTTGASSGAAETGLSGTDSTSAQGDSTTAAACEVSPSDIEGPFYREGIPVGSNLDVHDDDGLPLLLDGRVLDEGCAPIAGAVVEIWHATPRAPGAEPGDSDATYDSTATYRYYGQVATDELGRYAFETLRPGWYLNGPQYRPAHVHVKVWVGGVERLTTQLYFDDDPFNGKDMWFNPVMSLAPDEGGAATIDLVV